ncbi:MAG: penicillin-binding protein 2 [Firmicutes bacterium]|nr:penicillin-binding protein 2 [Bacillota bacterium]
MSENVDTISVNPGLLKNSDGTAFDKTALAKAFSDIFGIDYNDALNKLNSDSSYVTIAEKVGLDKVSELQNWMKSNNLSAGINIDPDNKRFYPYNNLASGVIGFTGTDTHGRAGIESSFDKLLSGTPGKVVTSTDSLNSEIPNTEQSYVPAKNGNDITLTIDSNIQSICEKYLSAAVQKYSAEGGNVIMMNPQTGDILAMADYPNYNLNTPFTPNSIIGKNWDTLDADARTKLLYEMWRNTAVQSTYEPGSTFKFITASVGLNENIVQPNHPGDFYCIGYETFADANDKDVQINDWTYPRSHGYESLQDAFANSCNPAFMQLGQKIGSSTLYKYYQAFGLFNTTSSGLYGESKSIFLPLNEVKTSPVNLATMSFGQRFTITPLQLITAVSAIANEGVLMKPNIIKSVKDPSTGSITTTQPEEVRQVLSKQTADEMMSIAQYEINNGTGKNAAVPGYSVAGKSGTSEPQYNKLENGYVSSFIALSPVQNTQVAVLVILYAPQGSNIQGGVIVAPVVSQILSEVLPYMDVASNSGAGSN